MIEIEERDLIDAIQCYYRLRDTPSINVEFRANQIIEDIKKKYL